MKRGQRQSLNVSTSWCSNSASGICSVANNDPEPTKQPTFGYDFCGSNAENPPRHVILHDSKIRRQTMPITITVAQGKGGVGKTTLAIAVAGELSRRGWDMALIDSDPQRSASQWAEPGNLHFPVYEIGLATETVANWAHYVRGVRAG